MSADVLLLFMSLFCPNSVHLCEQQSAIKIHVFFSHMLFSYIRYAKGVVKAT